MVNKFIVIEGLDGAGKTTQINEIVKWLQNTHGVDRDNIVLVREPGGTPAGEMMRTILKTQLEHNPLSARAELLLFFASRMQLVDTVIKPALAAGKWVIADRFYHSSIAYQGVGLGLLEECNALIDIFGIRDLPDIQILIDISSLMSIERTTARGQLDTIEARGVGFFESVRQYFSKQVYAGNLLCVDGNRPIDYVTTAIIDRLTNAMNK